MYDIYLQLVCSILLFTSTHTCPFYFLHPHIHVHFTFYIHTYMSILLFTSTHTCPFYIHTYMSILLFTSTHTCSFLLSNKTTCCILFVTHVLFICIFFYNLIKLKQYFFGFIFVVNISNIIIEQ